MHKLLMLICISLGLNASSLILNDGQIKAHTEVFGDSEINPQTKDIRSSLIIQNNIESIKGVVSISSLSLRSQKNDRDKNMYELLNVKFYPIILFRIREVSSIEDTYQIKGSLTLNGITKEVTSVATIGNSAQSLHIQGAFDIKLTQFNMDPPTMFFLTVRDKIEITYNLSYTKGE